MELLVSDDELVANLAPDHQQNHFLSINIIQHPQVLDSQFKLGKGVGTQPLDRLRRGGWSILEFRENRHLHDPLFPSRKAPQLRLGICRMVIR
jgi:hypothetical protein